jgi:hypothetical protein
LPSGGRGVRFVREQIRQRVIQLRRFNRLADLCRKERGFFATSNLALEKIYSRAENLGDEDTLRPLAA